LSFQIDQTASYGPRLRLYGHQKPTTNHPTNIHLYYAGKITREATLELTIKCVTNFMLNLNSSKVHLHMDWYMKLKLVWWIYVELSS